LEGALEAVVVLAAAAVQAATEQAQDLFYLPHLLLPLALAALPAVRVRLILPELEQEPMAAPVTHLFLPLLLH
jgi:hypothetical protein